MQVMFPKIIFAAVLGTLIGMIDFTNDEVQPAVLLILISSFLLGYLYPRKFWLFALIIGSGIFIGSHVMLYLGFTPRYQVEPNQFASFIAIIPAFIGALVGVGMRKYFFTSSTKRSR